MRRASIAAAAIATTCLLGSCSGTAGSTATPTPSPATHAASSVAADDTSDATVSSDAVRTADSARTAASSADGAEHSADGDPELPTVDVLAVPGDPQELVDQVDLERLMADIRAIATGPRQVNDDNAAALDAAGYISDEFAAAGREPHRIDVDAMGTTLPTVWVAIPGSRCADRVFVVTGHYDTVPGSPGADDDASGIAAVLELARVLGKAELPATVVLGAVPFEEQGLPYYGAAALADELQAAHRTVIGMVSAEMLGYALPEPSASGDPGDYLYLLGYPDAAGLVATFSAAGDAWAHGFGNAAGTSTPAEGYIERSDHAAFHARGIPAAFATDGADRRTPYYHTPDDTVAHIDRPFLLGSVRTLAAGVIAAATLGVGEQTSAGGACV